MNAQTPHLRVAKLDGEFAGLEVIYPVPESPDGPAWLLQDDCGIVCTADTVHHLDYPDEDFTLRLEEAAGDAVRRLEGEPAVPWPSRLGAQARELAASLGWPVPGD